MGQAEQKYTLTLTSSKLHWYPFRLYHLFLLLQLIQESFLQFNFLLLQKSEGNNCSIVKPWHKFSRAKLIVRSVVKWRKFQPKKTLQQLWSASTQDSRKALNQWRTGKNLFFNLFVQISGQIWTVVSRGYFLHESSHSENVASARRVELRKITETNNLNYPVGAENPNWLQVKESIIKKHGQQV